jgi:pentatricopeptide repeat protein
MDAPEGALKLLRTMIQHHLAGDESLRPDMITYSAVISAFARAGQAEHAEALLAEMYSDYLDGNNSAKLSIISFSTILDA